MLMSKLCKLTVSMQQTNRSNCVALGDFFKHSFKNYIVAYVVGNKMGKNYGEIVKNTFLVFKIGKNKRGKTANKKKNTFGSQ